MAQGQVLSGDDDACSTAIDDAYRLVMHTDRTGVDEDPATIGRHCTHRYVQAHHGYCWLQLGKPRDAASALEDALEAWPTQYRQDEGLTRAWLALSYADLRRYGDAATHGTQALTLPTTTARTLRTLSALDARLPTDPAPEFSHFRAAYTAAAVANMM